MAASEQQPFELTAQAVPGGSQIALRGELDMSGAPLLTRELERAESTHPRRIVLDFTGLRFMDASGLRAILGVARRVREAGGSVVIANPPPHIVRLLELTAIDQTVEVVERPLATAR